jgi:hypothetical protein
VAAVWNERCVRRLVSGGCWCRGRCEAKLCEESRFVGCKISACVSQGEKLSLWSSIGMTVTRRPLVACDNHIWNPCPPRKCQKGRKYDAHSSPLSALNASPRYLVLQTIRCRPSSLFQSPTAVAFAADCMSLSRSVGGLLSLRSSSTLW